jgi:hypothetical protein
MAWDTIEQEDPGLGTYKNVLFSTCVDVWVFPLKSHDVKRLNLEHLFDTAKQYKPMEASQSLSPHLQSSLFATIPLEKEHVTGGRLLQVLLEETQ